MWCQRTQQEFAFLGHVFSSGILNVIVVHDDAPIEQQFFKPVWTTGCEQQNEPARIGGEMLTEKFLFQWLEATLRRNGDQQ